MNEQNNMPMEFTTMAQAKKAHGISYLGITNSSGKIAKNMKANQLTYVLYLMPSNGSGYNVCAMATKECIAGCLNTSGRAKMAKSAKLIHNARLIKTKLFFENRNYFMNWLVAELETGIRKADRMGLTFSVRLNGTSDLNWNAYKINGKTIFELFNNIQFYDYTKIANKFDNVAPNYHLTYSYTGYNWSNSETLLSKGFNVAMVFNIKKGQPLPMTYKGFKVIDGDITDYRPSDGKGVIVGLRWKQIANKEINKEVSNGIFVVQAHDVNCGYAIVPKNKQIKKVA